MRNSYKPALEKGTNFIGRFKPLLRRKGGGGGGGGKGGGGSSGGKGSSSSGKGSSGSPSRGSSISISSSSSKKATPYSSGGGTPFRVPSGQPFEGRQVGGGSRGSIYGNSRYGSGYPYGGTGQFVSHRPFPFGFWPIYIGPSYHGSGPYGPPNNSSRPGGILMSASIQPVNTSETYRVIGDLDSLQVVVDALVSSCTVINGTAVPVTVVVPESIIQWYRASSFALSLDGYNNTAALASNAPATNDTAPSNLPDTPLPPSLDLTPLQCINNTIAASLPILDGDPDAALSPGQIAGIVIGSIAGLFLLICCCSCFIGPRLRRRRDRVSTPLIKTTSLPASSSPRMSISPLIPPSPPMPQAPLMPHSPLMTPYDTYHSHSSASLSPFPQPQPPPYQSH